MQQQRSSARCGTARRSAPMSCLRIRRTILARGAMAIRRDFSPRCSRGAHRVRCLVCSSTLRLPRRRTRPVSVAGRAFSLGEISGIADQLVPVGRRLHRRAPCRWADSLAPAPCSAASSHGPGARWPCSRSDGVRVVLASSKCQAADQAMFRHVGIEPVQQRILALKSSVHFRADFQPIAREVLVVAAPGPAKADLGNRFPTGPVCPDSGCPAAAPHWDFRVHSRVTAGH